MYIKINMMNYSVKTNNTLECQDHDTVWQLSKKMISSQIKMKCLEYEYHCISSSVIIMNIYTICILM